MDRIYTPQHSPFKRYDYLPLFRVLGSDRNSEASSARGCRALHLPAWAPGTSPAAVGEAARVSTCSGRKRVGAAGTTAGTRTRTWATHSGGPGAAPHEAGARATSKSDLFVNLTSFSPGTWETGRLVGCRKARTRGAHPRRLRGESGSPRSGSRGLHAPGQPRPRGSYPTPAPPGVPARPRRRGDLRGWTAARTRPGQTRPGTATHRPVRAAGFLEERGKPESGLRRPQDQAMRWHLLAAAASRSNRGFGVP